MQALWKLFSPQENNIARYAAIDTEASGGAYRDRTDDLKLAKLPLSQLSYKPA